MTSATNIKKRLIFCTYSSVYSSLILEKLLQNNNIEVVAIINSTRVLKPQYGHFLGAIQQIKKTGFRYSTYLFVITDLFSLFGSVLSKLKVFRPDSRLSTVHQMAQDHGIPVYETHDINSDNSTEFISQFLPDYMLAAHFNQLIKPALLNLTDIDFINIHPSLLPAYKGVDPVFFAMLKGEATLGVTLHKMSESFDDGEIISQKRMTVDSKQSLFENNCRLFIEGGRLATHWIALQDKKERNENLKPGKDSYDTWPTPGDVRLFKKKGNKLIQLKHFWRRVINHAA